MKRCAVLVMVVSALTACTSSSSRDIHTGKPETTVATAPAHATKTSESARSKETIAIGRERDEHFREIDREDPSSPTQTSSAAPLPSASDDTPESTVSDDSNCEYPPTLRSGGSDPIGGYVVDTAPQWPFRGLVQLWPGGDWQPYWYVRYLAVGVGADGCLTLSEAGQVPLPGEWAIDCIGQVAMTVHSQQGIEVGGLPSVSEGSFFLPWGAEPVWRAHPSEALIDEARGRTSNIEYDNFGDSLFLESDAQRSSYEIRSPPWSQSPGWTVRARHDGPLVLVTAQPAHLECFSGVSWLSEATTGRILACGGNTLATTYVSGVTQQVYQLRLPISREFEDYIECGLRLDLWHLADEFRYWDQS